MTELGFESKEREDRFFEGIEHSDRGIREAFRLGRISAVDEITFTIKGGKSVTAAIEALQKDGWRIKE